MFMRLVHATEVACTGNAAQLFAGHNTSLSGHYAHGKPVARLVPNNPGIDSAQAKSGATRIRARAAALKAGAFHWPKWKSWRDEGRREGSGSQVDGTLSLITETASAPLLSRLGRSSRPTSSAGFSSASPVACAPWRPRSWLNRASDRSASSRWPGEVRRCARRAARD